MRTDLLIWPTLLVCTAIQAQPSGLATKVTRMTNEQGVDLRPKINRLKMPIRKQGARGTCSVFAMTFLLEFAYRSSRGLPHEPLSPEFLNWAKNAAAGKQQDGDFFDTIDKGYVASGISSEALAPYQDTFHPETSPLKSASDDALRRRGHFHGSFLKPWSYAPATEAQLESIRNSLRKGTPVATGFRWPKEGKFKQDKISGKDVLSPIPEEDVYDGHSVVTVGYVSDSGAPGGGYFIFRNSWGEEWGESGYGYMSYAYFAKYLNDAFVYARSRDGKVQ